MGVARFEPKERASEPSTLPHARAPEAAATVPASTWAPYRYRTARPERNGSFCFLSSSLLAVHVHVLLLLISRRIRAYGLYMEYRDDMVDAFLLPG